MPLRRWRELSRNNITIIQTYYNERFYLETQIERWNCYNTPVNIILIDDGSQIEPAENVLKEHTLNDNINFSLYRVTDDIGFNGHGCRNLGARLAQSNWLLFQDIDYTLQPSDLKRLQTETLDLNSWYELNAKFKGRGNPYMALNQFLIPRKLFLDSGGYDESFVPFHYGDREFLSQLEHDYQKINLDWLILTCRRGGRKAKVDDTIKIPVYDDENMLIYTPRFELEKVVQKDTKLNFTWEKIVINRG
jgi:predicted glycosyltransferase involved in capsule biosynthesis